MIIKKYIIADIKINSMFIEDIIHESYGNYIVPPTKSVKSYHNRIAIDDIKQYFTEEKAMKSLETKHRDTDVLHWTILPIYVHATPTEIRYLKLKEIKSKL